MRHPKGYTVTAYTTRAGKVYRAQIRHRGRYVGQGGFASRREAERWAEEQIAMTERLRNDPQARARHYTLADVVARALNKKNLSDTQRGRYEYWARVYPRVPLADVDLSFAEDAFARLCAEGGSPWRTARPISEATASRYIEALRAILGYARRLDWTRELPFVWSKAEGERRGGRRTFWLDTPAKRAKALAVAADISDRLGLLVRLQLRSGQRVGALLQIRKEDIDLDNNEIRLVEGSDEKPNASLIVLETEDAIALREYLLQLPPDLRQSPWLFPAKTRPAEHLKRIPPKEAERFRVGLGLPRGTVTHVLRHSVVSGLIRAGMPLEQVMAITGHKSTTALRIYEHVRAADKARLAYREAARLLRQQGEAG